MKADLTRLTFDPTRHYRSVVMQQGRVQLDADWNEQGSLTHHRVEVETVDVVGPVGAPAADAGLELSLTPDQKSLLLSAGRLYVEGVLCENETPIPIDQQPDLPPNSCVLLDPAQTPVGLSGATDGTYLGVVHVWPRHLTALEQPSIREVALGGPDTATRVKNVWQVYLLRVGDLTASVNCESTPGAWTTLIQPPSVTLAARAQPSPDPSSPCKLSPSAGYRRLDNLLYRVETHLAPGLDPAVKWSHDNGSIEALWLGSAAGAVAGTLDLSVSSLGRDATLSIDAGHWVELFDDRTELLGIAGTLVQVTKAEGTTVTVQTSTATGTTDITKFPLNPRLRRWDGWMSIAQATQNSTDAGWIELEDGVEIKFAVVPATYRHGDYWVFPARTATRVAAAAIEWPQDGSGNPIFEPARGPFHHYARLGVLTCTGGIWSIADQCLPLFPPLTELENLYYVGGDAQSVVANESLTLPRPLEASVSAGSLPVPNAVVRFTVTGGTGTLLPVGVAGVGTATVDITTNSAGIAACSWTLDPLTTHQYVNAVLLEAGAPSASKYQPIDYSASLLEAENCACTVCVTPEAQNTNSQAIQNAIDTPGNGGVTVCLEAGVYKLTTALSVANRKALTLRGKGIATVLNAPGGQALTIMSSDQTTVEDLSFNCTSRAVGTVGILAGPELNGLRLERLSVVVSPAAGAAPDTTSTAVALTGTIANLSIADNDLQAPIGIGLAPGGAGVNLRGADIVANRFTCTTAGVQLNAITQATGLRLSRNRLPSGCNSVGIGIACQEAPDFVEIAGNALAVSGSGIFAAAPRLSIHDNDVSYQAGVGALATASGISATAPAAKAGGIYLTANRVDGFPQAGMKLDISVDPSATLVEGNTISGCSTGLACTAHGARQVIAIDRNHLHDFKQVASASFLPGISVQGFMRASVNNNVLASLGTVLRLGLLAGIHLQGCSEVQATANDISGLGPVQVTTATELFVVGVLVLPPFVDVDVSGNFIRRDIERILDGDQLSWTGVLIANVQNPQVLTGIIKTKPPSPIIWKNTGVKSLANATPIRATVRGNLISARGVGYCTAVLAVTNSCLSHNDCQRLLPRQTAVTKAAFAANVLVAGTNLTIDGNRVRDTPPPPAAANAVLPGMDLYGTGGAGFASPILGNTANLPILFNSAALPGIWVQLNLQA